MKGIRKKISTDDLTHFFKCLKEYAADEAQYLIKVNKLKDWIKRKSLCNFIVLTPLSEPVFIKDKAMNFSSRFKVILQNLTITVSSRKRFDIDIEINLATCNAHKLKKIGPNYYNQAIGGIIKFINVEFLTEAHSSIENILIYPKNSLLTLEACQAKSANVYIGAYYSFVEFKKSTFENSFTMIETLIAPRDSNTDAREKFKSLKDHKHSFFKSYDSQYNCLDVTGSQLESVYVGKNDIEMFAERSITPIYIGPHNIIGRQESNLFVSRTLINKWYKEAKERGDRKQELILNRELLKIEKNVSKMDEHTNSYFNIRTFSEIFLLDFGRITNDHKMSWTKPLLWMVVLQIMFFSALLYSQGYSFCVAEKWECFKSTSAIFVNLLNPTMSVKDILGLQEKNMVYEAAFFVKNIILAILSFQLVSAFKRYSTK
jgi:hypothetical protein